jgi:Pre-mRNA 3'-end-processing endonuclease polyadenylation factor C-term
MPNNQTVLKLNFQRRRFAKVMGALAEDGVKNGLPREGESVRGILVTQNFHSKIVAPSDIATYTPLRLGTIASKLHVPFAGSLEMLQLFLHEMFANVTEQPLNNDTNEQPLEDNVSSESQSKRSPVMYTLHGGEIRLITGVQPHVVTVEWQASPMGDMIADSVVALIMHAQSSVASIRMTSKPCRHARDDTPLDEDEEKKKLKPDDLVSDRLRFIRSILKEQFQNVEAVYEAFKGTYEIITDAGLKAGVLDADGTLTCQVVVEFDDALASTAKITVECPDNVLASNVQTTLQNAIVAAASVHTQNS